MTTKTKGIIIQLTGQHFMGDNETQQFFHLLNPYLFTKENVPYEHDICIKYLIHIANKTDLSLDDSSGIPRQISLSNRPALRNAGSNESGLFVAPITNTCKSVFVLNSENHIEC